MLQNGDNQLTDEQTTAGAVELATELTIAWLGNPHTRASADEVHAFLSTMHQKLGALVEPGVAADAEEQSAEYSPAVSVRKSLASPEVIISLIDGKPYKSLKRHLSRHGLRPDEYRQRYNLKADYPMVAPAYSEARRATAKRVGLGRKKGEPAPAKRADAAPKPRGRKSAADAKAATQDHLNG